MERWIQDLYAKRLLRQRFRRFSVERINVGEEYVQETVVQAAGAAPGATQTGFAAASSPAEAYVRAFYAATDGIRPGLRADSPEDLVRVAAAFRAAKAGVRRWSRDRAGGNDIQARELAEAFALGAWTWMMAGADDFAALLRDLQVIGHDALERE